ncbi:MAG: tol-pal system protein YbgF [Xanthomonadales bacterium]|nr:tol-pal system protein YbgF [Xanthomonadales bacterium]
MMLQVLKSNSRRALGGALAICALAVAAASPVMAQEDNMASRMILELQQMREEVRELRGMVEAQAQEIENLKRRQRDQYLDLDRRVGQMRGGSTEAPMPQTNASEGNEVAQNGSGRDSARDVSQPEVRQPTTDPAQQQPSGQTGRVAPPEVREPIAEQPEVVTLADPGSGDGRQLREPTEAEQQAYDQAFRALRETRYADAAEGFDAFLRDHPQSSYAPNALYWLGEVYYVTRDFETALAQFERLQETYPDSSKKPDALLKIGFSHYELGNWERARAALEQVIADFPGTNYSRLAENRLRTMRLEGNL